MKNHLITFADKSFYKTQNFCIKKAREFNRFETIEDMSRRANPFKVDYCGFGWILIKKGVYEKVPYPWFVPRVVQLKKPDGTILEDVQSEDISMCEDFRKYGFDIWINPKVRVGHQKMIAL